MTAAVWIGLGVLVLFAGLLSVIVFGGEQLDHARADIDFDEHTDEALAVGNDEPPRLSAAEVERLRAVAHRQANPVRHPSVRNSKGRA